MNDSVVLRVHRNERYKTISALCVEDERLSWKAKGLHTYLVTRPDNWSFSHAGLVGRSTDGAFAMKRALAELKDNGYLSITPVRSGGKIVSWMWEVRESPEQPLSTIPID